MTLHDPPLDDPPAGDHQTPKSSKDSVARRQKPTARSTTVGGAALAVLIAIYAVAQPILNERLGWQLPGVQHLIQDGGSAEAEKAEKNSQLTSSETTQRQQAPATSSAADASLLFGLLADQGNDRFLSPAGLLYVPGSQEGHRLKHVERHIADDPGRPGSHGVFDGGMADALATIDKAYRKAQTGTQTSKQEEGGRTIYTVDMGGRVGYVGGRDGRRRKNPMARRVRLVLERNRVITAYPM